METIVVRFCLDPFSLSFLELTYFMDDPQEKHQHGVRWSFGVNAKS